MSTTSTIVQALVLSAAFYASDVDVVIVMSHVYIKMNHCTFDQNKQKWEKWINGTHLELYSAAGCQGNVVEIESFILDQCITQYNAKVVAPVQQATIDADNYAQAHYGGASDCSGNPLSITSSTTIEETCVPYKLFGPYKEWFGCDGAQHAMHLVTNGIPYGYSPFFSSAVRKVSFNATFQDVDYTSYSTIQKETFQNVIKLSIATAKMMDREAISITSVAGGPAVVEGEVFCLSNAVATELASILLSNPARIFNATNGYDTSVYGQIPTISSATVTNPNTASTSAPTPSGRGSSKDEDKKDASTIVIVVCGFLLLVCGVVIGCGGARCEKDLHRKPEEGDSDKGRGSNQKVGVVNGISHTGKSSNVSLASPRGTVNDLKANVML
eukprot:jgi/Bigna1/85970/estExt_fgenesh1_pg.C_70145